MSTLLLEAEDLLNLYPDLEGTLLRIAEEAEALVLDSTWDLRGDLRREGDAYVTRIGVQIFSVCINATTISCVLPFGYVKVGEGGRLQRKLTSQVRSGIVKIIAEVLDKDFQGLNWPRVAA